MPLQSHNGPDREVESIIDTNMTVSARSSGRVWIVGAGPGDPGLITVRGLEALQSADVVIYDHLVSIELLEKTPPPCERIYVGKRAGKHIVSQEAINEMLVEHARKGKRVVRLKGGDPFIFGRGGEECIYLRERHIPFEVVPGVSAMSAVPAYAGIPLTHRAISASFTIVTGHEADDKDVLDVNWEAIARIKGTLVIFMGILHLPQICEQLIRYGRSPGTPVAVIRWGTVSEQQTVTGTLVDITQKIEALHLRPPGLVVVGEVVALREVMMWFEER